jgi:DNA mismatch endonuclease (patch repair protein)
MTDMVSRKRRSEIMRNIKPQNSFPEVLVRSLIHKMGFRFRLHVRSLPGTPDVVLPRHRKIILINGCFWHSHTCKKAGIPKSNRIFWKKKLRRNHQRDIENLIALKQMKWRVLVVWQCELKRPAHLLKRLTKFLADN